MGSYLTTYKETSLAFHKCPVHIKKKKIKRLIKELQQLKGLSFYQFDILDFVW